MSLQTEIETKELLEPHLKNMPTPKGLTRDYWLLVINLILDVISILIAQAITKHILGKIPKENNTHDYECYCELCHQEAGRNQAIKEIREGLSGNRVS